MNTTPIKDKLLSTNFLLAVLVLIFNAFGISGQLAGDAVALITGIIAFFGVAREAIKNATFIGWKEIFGMNGWNYIVAVVAAITPFADQIMPALKSVIDAIIAKNLPAIISSLFSMATIIWYIIKNPAKPRS